MKPREKETLPYATLRLNFVEAPKALSKGFSARASFEIGDGSKPFYASKWGQSEKMLNAFFAPYEEGEVVEAQIEDAGEYINLREMRKRTSNEIKIPEPKVLATPPAAKAALPLQDTNTPVDDLSMNVLIAYLRQTADLLEKKKKDVEAFI